MLLPDARTTACHDRVGELRATVGFSGVAIRERVVSWASRTGFAGVWCSYYSVIIASRQALLRANAAPMRRPSLIPRSAQRNEAVDKPAPAGVE